MFWFSVLSSYVDVNFTINRIHDNEREYNVHIVYFRVEEC